MSDLNTVPVPQDGFCIREIGEETVFLANKGDVIHSLDEIGTFIWRAIDGTKSLSEIADLICREYEVGDEAARKDLLAFVNELAEKKIVAMEPAG